MQITLQIVRRLQRSLGVRRASNTVMTLAVIPAGREAPVPLFARRLAEALGQFGSTLHLDGARVDGLLGQGSAQTPQHGPGSNRIVGWLNEQELSHQYVIYEADAVRSNWTRRCLRQADRVLAVGQAGTDPALGPIEEEARRSGGSESLARQDLVLLHEDGSGRPAGTSDWLRLRRLERHHHLRLSSSGDVQRLARILTGRGVGIVLGGGGARGLSHLGALRALAECRIPIDAIGGTSMGAIIAALPAMGMDYPTMYEACRDYFVKGRLLDFTLPVVSLTSGARIARRLAAFFGDAQIEDLWVNYYCISSNLTRAEAVVHRDGPVWKRVRASISLPGILPPIFHNGDLLVDGGVINNLPVDVMRSLCEGGMVIALDVTPKVDLTHREPFPEVISGWRVLARRANPFGKPMHVPQLASVLVRTTLLGSSSTQNLMAQRADLVLRPPLEQFGLLEFKSFDQIVDIGYRHALERLEASAIRRPPAPEDLVTRRDAPQTAMAHV
jgi:NTE family protein/lysophospholipid hydrolase